ncbi:30S ribosomal protein S8 [Patescibacteria group bacterium]|nr:30S ribosomal protein S8 [Patescibacteria group bacterium]
MYTDPIADMLTRIRNALRARKTELTVPHSKIKENILEVMKKREFIQDFNTVTENNHKAIEIELKEDKKDLTLRRVSSPGQRIYVKNTELKMIKSGLGITIVSTPKGVMTNSEAKRANLGGELLCEIY